MSGYVDYLIESKFLNFLSEMSRLFNVANFITQIKFTTKYFTNEKLLVSPVYLEWMVHRH